MFPFISIVSNVLLQLLHITGKQLNKCRIDTKWVNQICQTVTSDTNENAWILERSQGHGRI